MTEVKHEKIDGELIVMQPPAKKESEPKTEVERDDLVALAEEAEARVEAIKKILIQAMKVTNYNDWVDQGGKPYLCVSGASKIADLFRINIVNVKREKMDCKDEKGKSYYFWVYTCDVKRGDRIIEGIEGTCSSRDKLFAMIGKDDAGKPLYKPTSEVDETNIMKAGQSNMIGRAITIILGLRNLTWEQLKETGMNIEKVAKVNYQSKNAAKTMDSKRIDFQNEAWRMALEMEGNDDSEAKKLCIRLSEYEWEGKKVKGRELKDFLTDARLKKTYDKIKAEYQKFCNSK